ncbi:unnamed protein product [Caenorhabditis brenneri]
MSPPPAEFERNLTPNEMNYALRKLYPHIRVNDNDIVPLPRKWDLSQASSYLELMPDGLTVSFKMNANVKEDKDPSGIVRADAPIPLSVGVYYFEVKVIQGHRGCMGIGLSKHGGELNRMPGWDAQCYGYHGDDGNFFSACGNGKPYGPKFETGDVIGCGMDTLLNLIFFTKNGKHLGIAYKGQPNQMDKLYPTVGMKNPGERLSVNFGQHKFMFNFELYRKHLENQKIRNLEEIPMSDDIGKYLDRVVTSFLGHSGALESLKVWEKVSKKQAKPVDHEFLRLRKEIVDMVMSAKHGSVIQEQIERSFPGCLERDYKVQLILMCLRYVDLANTMQKAPSSFRPTNEPGRPASPAEIRSRPPKLLKGSHCKSTKRTREAQKKHGKSRTPPPVRRSNNKAAEDLCLKNSKIEKFFIDEDTGEEMLSIDGISITKKMYVELYNSEEYGKLAYMLKMGREIMSLASKVGNELTAKDREILERSISMVLSPFPLEKHPISHEYRRYIANVMIEMINDHADNKPPPKSSQPGPSDKASPPPPESTIRENRIYSELRGMFLGWQGLHQEVSAKHGPATAICFVRKMVLEDLNFDEEPIEYSIEPMEESHEDDEEEMPATHPRRVQTRELDDAQAELGSDGEEDV